MAFSGRLEENVFTGVKHLEMCLLHTFWCLSNKTSKRSYLGYCKIGTGVPEWELSWRSLKERCLTNLELPQVWRRNDERQNLGENLKHWRGHNRKKKPYYLLISSKSSPNQLYHWTFHSGCHLNLRKWVCVLVPSPRLLKDPFTSHLLWKYFESHTVTQVGAGTGLGGVGEVSKQAAEGRKEQQAAMAWIKAIWIEGTGNIESLWKEANEAKWGNFLVADYSANWIAHIS